MLRLSMRVCKEEGLYYQFILKPTVIFLVQLSILNMILSSSLTSFLSKNNKEMYLRKSSEKEHAAVSGKSTSCIFRALNVITLLFKKRPCNFPKFCRNYVIKPDKVRNYIVLNCRNCRKIEVVKKSIIFNSLSIST